MNLLSVSMVTKSEQQVVDEYKEKGYNSIHKKKLGLKYKLIHIIDKEKQKKQMELLTSIQVTKEFKDSLNSMKRQGESYEEVIVRLIENKNKPKQKIEQPKKKTKELKPVRLIG